MRKRTALMMAIIIMTIFDYFATWHGIISGIGFEVNPLARLLFDWSLLGGMAVMAFISIGGIAVIWSNIRQRFVYHAAIFVCGYKAAITVVHVLGLIATYWGGCAK